MLLAVLSSGASSRGEVVEARRFGLAALGLNIAGIVTTLIIIATVLSLFFTRSEECGDTHCWYYEECYYSFYDGFYCGD